MKPDEAQAAKAPQWRPLLIGLLIALVMVTIMATTYISANHGVVAHNLPWGITGPSNLGVVLPPQNGLYLIRNTLYFRGNSLTRPLIALGIYVLVGWALVTFFSWGNVLWWRGSKDEGGKKTREDISPAEEIGTAAIPPG